jgi:hypothetical protein
MLKWHDAWMVIEDKLNIYFLLKLLIFFQICNDIKSSGFYIVWSNRILLCLVTLSCKKRRGLIFSSRLCRSHFAFPSLFPEAISPDQISRPLSICNSLSYSLADAVSRDVDRSLLTRTTGITSVWQKSGCVLCASNAHLLYIMSLTFVGWICSKIDTRVWLWLASGEEAAGERASKLPVTVHNVWVEPHESCMIWWRERRIRFICGSHAPHGSTTALREKCIFAVWHTFSRKTFRAKSTMSGHFYAICQPALLFCASNLESA